MGQHVVLVLVADYIVLLGCTFRLGSVSAAFCCCASHSVCWIPAHTGIDRYNPVPSSIGTSPVKQYVQSILFVLDLQRNDYFCGFGPLQSLDILQHLGRLIGMLMIYD